MIYIGRHTTKNKFVLITIPICFFIGLFIILFALNNRPDNSMSAKIPYFLSLVLGIIFILVVKITLRVIHKYASRNVIRPLERW